MTDNELMKSTLRLQVGLAAMLAGKINKAGKNAVLVLTGRNINADKLLRLMASNDTISQGGL